MKWDSCTARTLTEALAGFRPGRRTRAETVPLADALHRIPAAPVTAEHPLPGFARSTVDGYAVRASDTAEASGSLPGYLHVAGAVRMGAAPDVAVGPGTAVAVPAGGMLPPGADAVVTAEDAAEATSGTIAVALPVATGDGVHRADEDAVSGAAIVPAGRPLRPQDLGMLAAAGVTSVTVHARPVVTIFSAGDEVVPPDTPVLMPGQVRDATGVALAALVTDAGGDPVPGGIAAADPGLLEAALRPALDTSDLIVVSAGSSAGIRDVAAAVGRLGEPGIWCQALAIKPGAATLLADCAGVPVIGLPGNPRSALVVFRLIGMPLVRLVGGCTRPPAEAVVRTRLGSGLASACGRLDVVQVRLCADEVALSAVPAVRSMLTAADGYVIVPEETTRLGTGSEVDVTLYR
jgi:molybdopterin molybdotransferase